MPKVIGPTIPRWRLGESLRELREATGKEREEIAELLDCSESRVRKIEEGRMKAQRAELLLLLDTYGVDDPETRESLLLLAKQGKERGYWATYGTFPNPLANLLGLEGAASTIRVFQSLMVDGLLQTRDYAHALTEATWLPGQPDIESQVGMRMERQQLILDDDPPELWVILDEAVLHRPVGSPKIMHEQLNHLLQRGTASTITIQVVPTGHGAYHGILGPVKLLEFPDEFHSPVAYAETQAGSLYMEKESDVRRCNLVYNHMMAAALSPQETAKLIRAAAEKFKTEH